MKKSKNLIACFYVLAIFLLIPIFNKGTFHDLSVHKIQAFYFICGLSLALFCLVSLIEDFGKRNIEITKEPKIKFSRTDIAMAVFGSTVVLSALLSGHIKESFYGVSGFGMGALSIALMILSYFYISRFLITPKWIFHYIVATSIFPIALALINRAGIDLLNMYEQGADPKYSLYVSTLGNYGWFSEYMAIIIPIAIYMHVMTENVLERILYGMYLILALAAVTFCGTNMLMMTVFAVFILVLIRRFLTLVSEKDAVRAFAKKRLPWAFVIAVIVYYALILFVSGHDDMANGRGYIWNLSMDLYKNLPLKEKLIGVGPNRYMYVLNDYLGTRTGLSTFTSRFNDLALTSAHSEYLDYLINTGIIGLAAYTYMIYTVMSSFIREGFGERNKEIAFVSAISYMIYSLCNFSIVCATPMFFIYLAMCVSKEKE